MIALHKNVANCQNTLTVLTQRWRIFPQSNLMHIKTFFNMLKIKVHLKSVTFKYRFVSNGLEVRPLFKGTENILK